MPSTRHLPLAGQGLRDRGYGSERSFCLWIILQLSSRLVQLCWRVPGVLHLAWWCKAGVVERQGLSLGGEEVRGGRVQPTCRKASGPGGRPVRLGHGVGQRGCGTVCVCPGHLAGGPVGRRAPARCSVRECIRVAPGWCVVWGPVVLAGPEAGREQTLPGRKLVAWAMRDSRCLTWLSVIWVAMTLSVKGSVCAGAFETLTQLCEGPRRGGGGRGGVHAELQTLPLPDHRGVARSSRERPWPWPWTRADCRRLDSEGVSSLLISKGSSRVRVFNTHGVSFLKSLLLRKAFILYSLRSTKAEVIKCACRPEKTF